MSVDELLFGFYCVRVYVYVTVWSCLYILYCITLLYYFHTTEYTKQVRSLGSISPEKMSTAGFCTAAQLTQSL